MFGVSFLEIAMVGLVALIVVGPQKLPEMMRTAGEWVGRLRKLTHDMRAQTGIDDILREEGIDGVQELRTLLRGERALLARQTSRSYGYEAYSEAPDPLIEFPVEGPDTGGALPDDLLVDDGNAAEDAGVAARSTEVLSQEGAPPPLRSKSPGAPASERSAPESLPVPPTAPRRLHGRAITIPETPRSKSAPAVESPAPSSKKPAEGGE